MLKLLAAVGLVAMTCACASDPGPGPGPGPQAGHDGPPRGVGPQVFVSPFGEPFKADPGQPYPSAVWFARADANADGRLDHDEFQADGRRVFTGLDLNGDGVIGPDENAAYERSMEALFLGQDGPRGPGGPGMGGGRPGGRDGGPGGMGGPRAGLGEGGGQDDDGGGQQRRRTDRGPAVSPLSMANFLNVPQPVKAADTDTNQRITAREWSEVGDRWFGLLDANHDGALTLAELPETAIQRNLARHGGR
ncbi:hypothetical protein BH09PSE1_BH09PSE1_27220 [soil metagenome]